MGLWGKREVVWTNVHITVKELLPAVITCALWDCEWRSQSVLCQYDNAAVVAIIQ